MLIGFLVFFGATSGHAEDRTFRLAVPAELQDSGLLKYMLPRFSLKTQTRIQVVAPDAQADAALGGVGVPVFSGLERTWRLQVHAPEHPGVERFSAWIRSAVGQRAIVGFKVDGSQLFTLPKAEEAKTVALDLDGDAVAGQGLSRKLCGRCHVVAEDTRMNAIGSTPSFFVLRSLSDWTERFQSFFALNPHPAFTQIADVTAPFAEDRPPPIVPLELTLDDLEAIIAYAGTLAPADLGAPLQHQ